MTLLEQRNTGQRSVGPRDQSVGGSRTGGGTCRLGAVARNHRPPADGVTFLSCDVAEAVQIARRAAGGKNVEVLSPTIGRQLLERGRLDEMDLHVLPVLLGDGVRLYDPGGSPELLEFVNGDPVEEITLRCRPAGSIGPERPTDRIATLAQGLYRPHGQEHR